MILTNKTEKATVLAVLFLWLCFAGLLPVYGQSIPITQSPPMEEIKFDGKWSFAQEWKPSSLTEIKTETGLIYLRTAHWQEYIYVMIDAVADQSIDNNKDQAVICFDTQNDNSTKFSAKDFCFTVKLQTSEVISLQGSDKTNSFEIIPNHPGLIAIADSSDENDRYSKIPHSSYEFRIPLELLTRNDKYGFYVGIFDHSNSTIYTWPENVTINSIDEIPSPNKWGLIYSPDKSIPEYDLPMIILIISIVMVIFVSSRICRLNYLFKIF